MNKEQEWKQEGLRDKFEDLTNKEVLASNDITIDIGFSDVYVDWLEKQVLMLSESTGTHPPTYTEKEIARFFAWLEKKNKVKDVDGYETYKQENCITIAADYVFEYWVLNIKDIES